jgi:hypothetical protein
MVVLVKPAIERFTADPESRGGQAFVSEVAFHCCLRALMSQVWGE